MIINTFEKFKEAAYVGEIEHGFGYIEKYVDLYYGMTHSVRLLTGSDNLDKAYENYKNEHEFYDQWVSENSFLKNTSVKIEQGLCFNCGSGDLQYSGWEMYDSETMHSKYLCHRCGAAATETFEIKYKEDIDKELPL